jgi:ubiquinone/menaquinone biosynthesis C-methylase UbiE
MEHLHFSSLKKRGELTGIDYSKTLLKNAKGKSTSKTNFILGDVLNLKDLFPKENFDAIISIRCLINLPSEELQYQALENIFFLLKPKGNLLLSEGYQQGWEGLNSHRKQNNLEEMKIIKNNKFFNDINLEITYLVWGK